MTRREITSELLIPELLRAYPQARHVLDKYGLKGCGGPEGPYETLGFFARAHEVDERELMKEISNALSNAAPPVVLSPAMVVPALEDTIYRRFFLSAIFIVLTFGATWGAWLLYKIGSGGSFAAASLSQVDAHAQAQVYGWMGLFIMGFASQAFPRFWHSELWKPRLAVLSLCLMLVGIVVRSIGMVFESYISWLGYLAPAGAALEWIAVSVFCLEMHQTFIKSKQPLRPYIGFVSAALFWFITSTTLDFAGEIVKVAASQSHEQFAFLKASLRTMQFHGLALCMIVGVSLRTLPHFFDAPRVDERLTWIVLAAINAAVALEVLLVAFKAGASEVVAHLILFVTLVWLVVSWKIWKPFPDSDRSQKYCRIAYAWLLLAMLMLTMKPLYLWASGAAESDAYVGAVRHAFTVGFVSMMILGHASKVVPTLNGIDPGKLSRLWLPFILVNSGCLLRVVTQVLTDRLSMSYALIGISGMLEVAGIALWSAHIISVIVEGKRQEKVTSPTESSERETITEIISGMKVAQVLEAFPETEQVFLRFGFDQITNPSMRRSAAKVVTLKMACSMRGVDEDEFVRALNECAHPRQSS